MLNIEAYCAVRINEDGREYFLLPEMSHSIQTAKEKVDHTNASTPDWSKKNPVVRYSRFIVEERSVLETLKAKNM
jgi:hypothetical protein